MFLAAMRHFELALRDIGRPVHYCRLDEPRNCGSTTIATAGRHAAAAA